MMIEISEESPEKLSTETLTAEQARVLLEKYASQIDVTYEFFDQQFQVRSKGYVGYLPVSSDLALRIVPKVRVANIFRMLEYAYNLKSFELLKGQISIESLDDLLEGLASILARRVLDRARKGLYSSYVKETASLPFVRGRILIGPTLQSLSCGSTTLTCEYEEHTSDVDDNQILLWTLHCLRKFPFENQEFYQHVRRAHNVLAGSATLEEKKSQECINRSYHRLNADYRPMHLLCSLFLENLAPGLMIGQQAFQPFIIYMPQLFEKFVLRWLAKRAPDNISVQPRVERVKATETLTLEMDILLRDTSTEKVIAVLDTKYKKDPRPSSNDIYQISAYAREMNCKKAILVYPSTSSQHYEAELKDVSVQSLIFDISQDDLGGNAFWDELNQALEA